MNQKEKQKPVLKKCFHCSEFKEAKDMFLKTGYSNRYLCSKECKDKYFGKQIG